MDAFNTNYVIGWFVMGFISCIISNRSLTYQTGWLKRMVNVWLFCMGPIALALSIYFFIRHKLEGELYLNSGRF